MEWDVGFGAASGLTASIVTGMTGEFGEEDERTREQDLLCRSDNKLDREESESSGKIQSTNQERAKEAGLELHSAGTLSGSAKGLEGMEPIVVESMEGTLWQLARLIESDGETNDERSGGKCTEDDRGTTANESGEVIQDDETYIDYGEVGD